MWGLWGDGQALWAATGPSGGQSGAAAPLGDDGAGRLALDAANAAPRGLWSDGDTMWVSDAREDLLFAYHRRTGARQPSLDIDLHSDNAAPRGIWGGGGAMWVVDTRAAALFAYDRLTGDPTGAYALAAPNRNPQDLWSDGTTIWVTDNVDDRVYAYTHPRPPDPNNSGGFRRAALGRTVALELAARLAAAGNTSPRGIWSDGIDLRVWDSADRAAYTHPLPPRIVSRLTTIAINGTPLAGFAPHTTQYTTTRPAAPTTVAATPANPAATIAIEPPDADGDPANGHQTPAGTQQITIAVTSQDKTRTTAYRITLAPPPPNTADIELRDQLIADQEHLLNAYRCLHNTDTGAVPGGCTGNQPAQPPKTPAPPPPNPTPHDIELRDQLIADQENLLNTYRCQHNTDTHLTPDGCANGQPRPSPN